MVQRQHDPMVVEEMVVALAGRRRRMRRRGMHWRTRRWVEVTKPILQGKGGTPADELVNEGSLPDLACKVQIKGLNINWRCTVSRRLALRRSSKRDITNESSSPAVTCAAPASLIKFVAPSLAVADATPTTASENVAPAPADAHAAPYPVFKYVDPSPAGTCAAKAPVTVCAPAAAYAAPTPVSDYIDRAEATFEISGADTGGDADFLAEVEPLVDAGAQKH